MAWNIQNTNIWHSWRAGLEGGFGWEKGAIVTFLGIHAKEIV